jgi:hypothetical protein
MWRQETHGTFMLLMNAAMNFDHLQAGRKPMPPPSATAADEEDESPVAVKQGAHLDH